MSIYSHIKSSRSKNQFWVSLILLDPTWSKKTEDTNYPCCANADLTTAGAAMFYLHNDPGGGVWRFETLGVAWNDRFKNLGVGKGIASIIHSYFFCLVHWDLSCLFWCMLGIQFPSNPHKICVCQSLFRSFWSSAFIRTLPQWVGNWHHDGKEAWEALDYQWKTGYRGPTGCCWGCSSTQDPGIHQDPPGSTS